MGLDRVHGYCPAAVDIAKATATAPLAPLVLGVGNVLLGDDGVGVRVVERLRDRDGFAGARYVDGGTIGFGLFGAIEEANAMLVVDAADIGAPAGIVRVFEGVEMDRFLSIPRRRSVHEVGLSDLLDMARLAGCLPPRRALICMQPGRIDWGDTLSAPVADALPFAEEVAAGILERWESSP